MPFVSGLFFNIIIEKCIAVSGSHYSTTAIEHCWNWEYVNYSRLGDVESYSNFSDAHSIS